MSTRRELFFYLAAGSLLFAGTVVAQDAPSLGDIARQQRQQKVQSKSVSAKSSNSAAKIITNEEISKGAESQPGAEISTAAKAGENAPQPASQDAKQSPEDLRSEILSQKSQIASLQAQIDEVNESIQFAPPNCVTNCAQWNQQQKEKQQQVERARTQLEDLKKHLAEIQESARKQGLGSAIYEP
jgi:predicted RNase H-like nuclease (RuvC/YqgF family)